MLVHLADYMYVLLQHFACSTTSWNEVHCGIATLTELKGVNTTSTSGY